MVAILIPPAVRGEALLSAEGRPGAEAVAAASWIVQRSPAGIGYRGAGAGSLDAGEREAIALALELGGEVPILLDDAAARRVARSAGLEIFGSAGVLGLAKRMGLIAEVRPTLDRLVEAGLYLSAAAYASILRQVGERETQ